MKMKFGDNLNCLLAAACVLGWSATMVDAAPVWLIPDADTTLSNDSNRGPTVEHGSSSLWQVRWHTAPRVRIGYVRYDISSVDPSLFSTGSFHGTFTDSSKNGPGSGGTWDVWGLNDDVVAGGGIMGNDWDESNISYSNAGGVDNDAALGTFAFENATYLGTISTDGVDEQPLPFWSNTTDLDLTAFLNADTDGLVTFMFIDSVQEGSEYYVDSLEGNMSDGHGPMKLHFVPEPSCFVLFGLGLVGLWLRRRRM